MENQSNFITFGDFPKDDFASFAPKFLKIKTYYGPKTDQVEKIIPLNFNPTQQRLHVLFEQLLKTVGYVRIIVLKARREGISTYVEGRLFHKDVTNPNTHSFIIAQDKDGLNTIFEMSKLYYDMLPASHRPMKRYSSKKELVFENPNDRDRFSNPGLRSRIEVYSAQKGTALRSGGYTCGHLSEVAFYNDPDTLCPSVIPAVPDVPGSILVLESTANGRGNYFHNEWLKATDKKKKQSNFTPIFFSWLEFLEYVREWDYKGESDELIDSINDEEKMLVSKHKANARQLHWRRHKIMDLQDDIDLFHQEYPVDDVEAFITSGLPYFSRKKLRELLNKTVPPIFIGDITGLGKVENEDGPLFIWEEPEKGCEYVLGVDPKTGESESGDPAVIEVLKVPKNSPHIVQVAEWRDWVDPVVLAGKCIHLGRYYNEGMLSPEINAGGGGLTCLNEIKEHYWNIYRWQYFDRFAKQITNKLGWDTNMSTRPLLCDYTSACVNADILIIRSEGLIDEMMSFIKRSSTGGEADEGCCDDRVMAFMIALFTLAHSYQSGAILKELGLFMQPIVTDTSPKMIVSPWECDTSYLPNDAKMERESYFKCDMPWLNM